MRIADVDYLQVITLLKIIIQNIGKIPGNHEMIGLLRRLDTTGQCRGSRITDIDHLQKAAIVEVTIQHIGKVIGNNDKIGPRRCLGTADYHRCSRITDIQHLQARIILHIGKVTGKANGCHVSRIVAAGHDRF